MTNCFCLPQTRVWMSAFCFRNKPVCSWKNIPAQSPDISVVFSLIESSIVMSDNKAYSCNSQIFFEKRILNGKIITITLTVSCVCRVILQLVTHEQKLLSDFLLLFLNFFLLKLLSCRQKLCQRLFQSQCPCQELNSQLSVDVFMHKVLQFCTSVDLFWMRTPEGKSRRLFVCNSFPYLCT